MADLKFLNQILKKNNQYKTLLTSISEGALPCLATGVCDVHKALIVSALSCHQNKKILLITPDEPSAAKLIEDLKNLNVKVHSFESRDFVLNNAFGSSKDYEHKRLYTLFGILNGECDVVVSSIQAAAQYTLPANVLEQNAFNLQVGATVNDADLISNLLSSGYCRCEQVEGKGQFSKRGGIIDIFCPSDLKPYRIEFWGDEIDSISTFDVTNQRRIEQVDSIRITPAQEITAAPSDIENMLLKLKSQKLSEAQLAQVNSDLERVKYGESVNLDRYINLIYQTPYTLFDYAKDYLLLVSDAADVQINLRAYLENYALDTETLLEQGHIFSQTGKLYLDEAQVTKILEEGSVLFENFTRRSFNIPLKQSIAFTYKRNAIWNGSIDYLCEDVKNALSANLSVVIAATNDKSGKIIADDLSARGIPCTFLENVSTLPKGVVVTVGALSAGFEIENSVLFIPASRFIASKKRKSLNTDSSKKITSLSEIEKGDYVVHTSHGIGVFAGIETITANKITKDYIKIKYAGTDVLYVPVTQLDLVSKYIGSKEDGTVKLHKLSGTEWQNTRKRVRAAVKNMAKQLTALYAKRMSAKGYAFCEDTDLQRDFECRFEFDETEDQLRCVNEIKRDMERPVPMDRLLCGDVGFGKTEVALRAAFKCMSEGKQCAILVPTTILAWQHYNTALRRFSNFALNIAMLSRFVDAKTQSRVIKGLKSGAVDMVIGTHRLISKDVKFKDLGLVIVDEEQRFGVAQKERLKELYPSVDVLTLSATPIPRTLNMAMSGLRDMSCIDEAPLDRYPVTSYVIEHNDAIIFDAINRELRRSGQVYYLHNRVDTIDRTALKLQNAFPNFKVATAHGKMSEDALSDVWKRLVEHEIDILVCTSIIETGVDISNANTLIIEDADRMGLSQLHQLRGRVGRSPRRAYAYFCFKPYKQISEVATKRLEAMREFTEFGAGFKIALRDLEIRGAGSILGGEQHGHLEAVGYDMYLKMLNDAVNEENGLSPVEENECTVDIYVSAHIPEKYMPSAANRIEMYKRIAAISSQADVLDVTDELLDRFGEPPKSVLGLVDIAYIRNLAIKCGICEIVQRDDLVTCFVNSINMQSMSVLSDTFKGRFFISAGAKPSFSVKLKKGESNLAILKQIVELLNKENQTN